MRYQASDAKAKGRHIDILIAQRREISKQAVGELSSKTQAAGNKLPWETKTGARSMLYATTL